MKIDIAIVEHEGQLWFELDGVKFDMLYADYEFDQKKEVQVVRGGKVIAKAWVMVSRDDMIFSDYGAKSKIRLQGNALNPEDFYVGDHLVVEVLDGFDLLDALRRSSWLLEGMINTVSVGEEVSIAEMQERMSPELKRTQQAAAASQVIRFYRGKIK